MSYEHTEWCCDFCYEGFESERQAELHEKNCDKNPENKLLELSEEEIDNLYEESN